jgi:hypothetical protein
MLAAMWDSLRGLARLLAVLVTAAVAGLLALVGAATATTRIPLAWSVARTASANRVWSSTIKVRIWSSTLVPS